MVFYIKVTEGLITQTGYGMSLPVGCIEKTKEECENYDIGDAYDE